MRFILALCIVVGCTLCGRSLAGSVRRRTLLLEELTRGLKLLRLHMTSMFETVNDALQATECPPLARIGRDMQPGDSAREAWERFERRQSRRGGEIDALTREDRRVLENLFHHLGESGRDAQELLLGGAIAALEHHLEAARQRAAEADRLYVSLGLLTGLTLALIVI